MKKQIFIFVTCLTAATTFGLIRAYGADATDCKNIVQTAAGDNKVVKCDPTKQSCAKPAPASTEGAGRTTAE